MGDVTTIAPKVYETKMINHRMGYIMDEVQGVLFQKAIDQNPLSFKENAALLGKTHRQLHDVPITPALEELPKYTNFMKSFLLKNNTLDEQVNLWLIQLLETLPDDRCLLHGDFMPYNIICGENGLKVIDWAEPAIGPAEVDIARTINFIFDSSDYTESVMTKESIVFIKSYLQGYYNDCCFDKDQLHNALLLNAAVEVFWAVKSNGLDQYTTEQKKFIQRNFESSNQTYLPFLL